ncbi:hypothetical protein [Streptomyces liliifuscus]|uniref:Uncharacterized protein n=1 Tax=Streptomyces liliifuscus TaxID=2797636 RepID=A0A7T7L292_9ACTN|nr:hypothetical protein [Streptomyces liliifuscus]QQM45100.1 hypothetical protein JEQ17_40695 [Streptomyces liliifuscus]
MLDVAYRAVDDLPPGRLARIDEDRGRIRVRLDRREPLHKVVSQLNVEIDQLMKTARWFQLWDDEIVSANTPGRPLRIEYMLSPVIPSQMGVGVAEGKGLLRVHICPGLDVISFAASMNPATKEHLDGGHWFQLYGGEIIDNSPEPMNRV